jgi:tRNA dimethylallyltransferase
MRARLETRSLSALCAELTALDPESAHTLDLHNPRRVIRALEVCLLTGKAFSSFRTQPQLGAVPAGIWLTLPRETLHARIAGRASKLFEDGVGAEVRAALPLLGPTAGQVIGIQQVSSVLAGEVSEHDATVKIIQATRQYARRQETWFRKERALLATPSETAEETALQIAAQRISAM